MEPAHGEIACTVDIKPGKKLTLPESLVEGVGPGRWVVSVQLCEAPVASSGNRLHDASLKGYAPQDEGLYDDLAR